MEVGSVASSSKVPDDMVRNVVLVHGAYADGSSWAGVIEYLQDAGLNVSSVQNPLTSIADDVACTHRALALQDGPTILAGHSFAGTVITEAGVDPKVVGLVYVAARAPDAGEDYGALAKRFPTPPANAGLVYVDGFGGSQKTRFSTTSPTELTPPKRTCCTRRRDVLPKNSFRTVRRLLPGPQSHRGTQSRSKTARRRPISSTSSPIA